MRQSKKERRKQELEPFFNHIQEEFSQLYPELEGLSDEESLEVRKRLIEEQEIDNSKRLKEHTEVFSDAIIAIIATVMLLEIPLPTEVSRFHDFLFSIFIFLTTFFIVLDKWWDNHKQFNQVKTITPAIVISQFGFMAGLALLPIFARWMMEDVTTIAVLSYGIAVLITNFFHWLIGYLISSLRFQDTTYTKQLINRMNYRRLLGTFLLSLVILALSFINPQIAFYFYIINPIISFRHSLKSQARQPLQR
ncbi:TMEM175 family protein [Streptococcus sp. zg-JUN1979]|uniref:TMEM175 family protein n=1 Tax=Streptococcus sp. zg-JUN1979 TaxID=3391450 RepID=UPI0039A72CD5